MRLAPVLQSFFTDRLVIQRQASPATIAAYRDTFRLLLAWLAATTGAQPAAIDLGQLDVTTISAFLTYLQEQRGNSTNTRNARLTAILRCSTMPHSRRPNMPSRSRGCSRSHPNAVTGPWCPS